MTFDEAAKVRLGRRLRHIRTQNQRTIKEVAEEIGVSAPALWRWEKGEARPRPKNLRAFANMFGVSETELLSGNDESASENDAGQSASTSPDESAPDDSMPPLSEVITESKERIAEVAGAAPGQITIIIEV